MNVSRAGLDHYYKRIFPLVVHELVRMVTLNFKYEMWRVEFVPRWERDDGTVMNRSHVFRTPDELVFYCQRTLPHSMQVGGVMPGRLGSVYFSSEEQDKASRARDRSDLKDGTGMAFGPLVIDIDMDDYDRKDVCPCGEQKTMCQVCYGTYIKAARCVVEYWMCQVFKFTSLVQVYSGKKGIHIWICCERAFHLTGDQRKAILERIQFPMYNDGHARYILQEYLMPIFKGCPSLSRRDPTATEEVVWSLLYPKMDMAVGTSASHLKKLPLLPHQTTGFVSLCLPPLRLADDVLLSQLQVRHLDLDPEQAKMYAQSLNTFLSQ